MDVIDSHTLIRHYLIKPKANQFAIFRDSSVQLCFSIPDYSSLIPPRFSLFCLIIKSSCRAKIPTIFLLFLLSSHHSRLRLHEILERSPKNPIAGLHVAVLVTHMLRLRSLESFKLWATPALVQRAKRLIPSANISRLAEARGYGPTFYCCCC